MTINSKDLENIVKSIAKAVGFDTRTYLNESNTDTHNALIHLRGDYINTNIRNMVIAGKDNLELKHFKRFSWMGVFIIDRENKVTINVSSRGTIDRIKSSRKRNRPHYLSSMCHVLNGDLVSPCKQIALDGFELSDDFTEDEYSADFESIVDMAWSQYNGYHHYTVAYEAENFEIKSIYLMLLDKDLDLVEETSLMEMLRPDFGTLTSAIPVEETEPRVKDSHSLVKVKSGIKSKNSNEPERKAEIYTKEEEAAKRA